MPGHRWACGGAGAPREPIGPGPAPTGMDVLGFLLFLGIWIVLQTVVFPRLGVPS